MEKPKKMRLFIGSSVDFLPVDEDMAGKLAEHFLCPIKFVEPANIHLTWKFLGDTESTKVDEVVNTIEETVSEASNITIKFDKFEIWRKRNIPSLLVLTGIDMNKNATELYQKLDKAFEKLGIPSSSRTFAPHITVARYKIKQKPVPKVVLPDWLKFAEASIEFANLCLFESTFVEKGHVYTPVKTFKLNGSVK